MLWLYTVCLTVPYTSSNVVAPHVRRAFRLKPADDQEVVQEWDRALLNEFWLDTAALQRAARRFAKMDHDDSGSLDMAELAVLERWVSNSFAPTSTASRLTKKCCRRRQEVGSDVLPEEQRALHASLVACDVDNDESLNFPEFVTWYGKRQKQMYEEKKKKKKKREHKTRNALAEKAHALAHSPRMRSLTQKTAALTDKLAQKRDALADALTEPIDLHLHLPSFSLRKSKKETD